MTAITTEAALLSYLNQHKLAYTRVEHPPVYTCEEASLYRGPMSGAETKNLFLRDEKHNFYLVLTDCAKRLDMKRLGQAVGEKKLHFASEEQLLEALGLTPGAVTLLALVNDPLRRVRLLVDADYWPSPAYLCHPLVNTATLVIEHEVLLRFLALTGHTPEVVRMPARAE